MAEESAQTVLQRLLRTAGEAAIGAEVTPTRVMRLSMARAAQTAIGLHLTVLGVTEEVMPFDDVLALVADDMMLLSLDRRDQPLGFAALDLQLRTATVELQTIGEKSDDPAQERGITDADAALCAPLVTEFIQDLARTAEDTPIEGWADGFVAGVRYPSARAIGMELEDRPMRLVRLQLDLGGNERQAELLVTLPAGAKPQPSLTKNCNEASFDQQLRETVMASPTELTAVLHRLSLPLSEVRNFEVGQVIGLAGVTVGSVRLEASDGSKVADARLGQATGLRALRIEQPARPNMTEPAIGQDRQLGGDMAPAGGMGMPVLAAAAPGDGGFDGMAELPGAGAGNGGFPALGAPDDMADMLSPPEDDGADFGLADPMAAGETDPGDALPDMPDFGAGPVGEDDFGFPAMDELPEPG